MAGGPQEFIFYASNKQFVLDNTASAMRAFILYNSNLQLSDVTLGPRISDFEVSEALVATIPSNLYNILFRYKPSGVYSEFAVNFYTSPPLLIFTSNSANLDTGKACDFTDKNGYTADVSANPAFDTPYTTEAVLYPAGDGGGDPHINPFYNPLNLTYVLPSNDSVYKYFDNLDPLDRIVLNAKMWVLNGDYMVYLDNLFRLRLKSNSSFKESTKSESESESESDLLDLYDLHKNIFVLSKNFKPNDLSFVRYFALLKLRNDEILDSFILDTETFEEVNFNIEFINTYNFLLISSPHEHFKGSNIEPVKSYFISVRKHFKVVRNAVCRTISVP